MASPGPRRASEGSSALEMAKRRAQYSQQIQTLKNSMAKQRRELQQAKTDMFGRGGKKHVLASRARMQSPARQSRALMRSRAAGSPGPSFQQVKPRLAAVAGQASRMPPGSPIVAPHVESATAEGVLSADAFSNRYTVLRRIGSGSFGTVSLIRSKDEHRLYAMKSLQYTADGSSHRRALHEVSLLKGLSHPNIVEFKDAFLSANGRNLSIVMSYCESGDLHTNLEQHKIRGESVPEPQVLRWFVQLLLALHHIHGQKILHRDLKPKNIFLSASKTLLKLGDFGLSRVLENTNANALTEVGTPCYTSPEICRNQPYSRPSDVWALGCVLYEIMALRVPFSGGTIVELAMNVMQREPEPLDAQYSAELRQLVGSMLSKNPADRPTVSQLLAHPLIRRQMHSFVETFPVNMVVAADMRRRRAELAGLRRQVRTISEEAAPAEAPAETPPAEAKTEAQQALSMSLKASSKALDEDDDLARERASTPSDNLDGFASSGESGDEVEEAIAEVISGGEDGLARSIEVHRLEETVQEEQDLADVAAEIEEVLSTPVTTPQSSPTARDPASRPRAFSED